MTIRPVLLAATLSAAAVFTFAIVGCSSASPASTGATSSNAGPTAGGSASASKLATYEKAPCTLVPKATVTSTVGYSFSSVNSLPSATEGECLYDPADATKTTVNVGFNTYLITNLHSAYASAPFVTIDGFRSFCALNKNVAGSEFYATISSSETLYLTASTCTVATSMARVALGKLS